MNPLPRVHLASLPTPVEELRRLGEHLGGPALFVKRDDLTGLAFGGNKTRKLEFLGGAAQTVVADTLLTAGAIQSNHCRQTAAAAARMGMDCKLILVGEEPNSAEGNLLLDGLLGAKVHWTNKENRDSDLHVLFEKTKAEGRKPYLIPYGGSNPVGAAAYAFALEELLSQVEPAWIVFATSSGGTQAGLLAGARLLGFRGRILGISVDEKAEGLGPRIANLATETLNLLGSKEIVVKDEVLINDNFLGGGYAVMGKPESEAIHLFASLEGLLVDPVYTGRAAAALIDLVRTGYFKKDERVLFWHTGGTPALFAQRYSRVLQDKLK